MTDYNLHTIRELLGEAFSSGEITTLAFDLFHDVYQDFTSGMTRDQKIRMVVDKANKTGKLPELLAYVQRQNAYQYGRYAPKLMLAQQPDNGADEPVPNPAPVHGGPPNHNPQGRTNILFVSSDPTDEARLRLGKESSQIEDQILKGADRENLGFQQRHAVKVDDFTFALVNYKPDIVHFSGHGRAEGGILFEDELGAAFEVPADTLGFVFQNFPKRVKCVLLNACYSRHQAEAIASHVDCVIGMNDAISDKAAIAFAVGFYQMLAGGSSIEEAYRWGCVQIKLKAPGLEEHLTPELIVNQ